jgi:hypothetical protein
LGRITEELRVCNKLKEDASKELTAGKIRFRQEFRYPVLTVLEIRMVWLLMCLVSITPIVIFQFIDVCISGPYLLLSLTVGMIFIVLIVSISYPVLMYFGRLQISIDKKWAVVLVTDSFVIFTNMDEPGLGLSDIVNREKDQNRVIIVYQIKNILRIKPHWAEFKTRLWRERGDLRMLGIRRHGEYSDSIINDQIYIPRAAVRSLLSTIRARNPAVNVDRSLG